jgi:hypothetical protein
MFEFIHHPEYGCIDLKGLMESMPLEISMSTMAFIKAESTIKKVMKTFS